MRIFIITFLVFPIWVYSQNPDEVNYFSGINIDFSGTQGVDYAEEYEYHDTLVTDRRVVYIKDTTTITLSHNERNNVTNGYGTYFHPIGINGKDGIADSGDEGIFRFKVDFDYNKTYHYAGSAETYLYPTYPNGSSFSTLTYPDGVTSVIGTTGHSTGTISDPAAHYRGIVGPYGDEWHTIAFWDDDQAFIQPLGGKEEAWSSDGKQISFVVNPKTPALQVWVTGDAEYYTTPAKTYMIPKIHEQTTYFDVNTGGVNLQLIDINGNNVFYRINGGSFTDAGSNSVTLTDADFSNGSNTLEYYYAGNVAYTKTRIVVKNPTHPSNGSTQGLFAWGGSQVEQDAWLIRAVTGEYDYTYNRMKDDDGTNLHGYWLQNGMNGERRYMFKTDPYLVVTHPRQGGGVFPSALTALTDGFDQRRWGDPYLTYGEFAIQMALGTPWFRLDPIGWEGDHSQGSYPSKEVISAGYYSVNQIWDVAFGYDLLAGYFRDDQVAGGMTPIENLYIRDGLAKWVVLCNTEFRSHSDPGPRPGGLWDTAKWSGSWAISLIMPEYSTSYYGTSGYGTVQTGYAYTPFPDESPTWKETFFTAPQTWLYYPNRGRLPTPEPAELFTSDGHWVDDNSGYYDLMSPTFDLVLNLSEMYDKQNWPILEQGVTHGISGTLEAQGVLTNKKYHPRLANNFQPVLGPLAKGQIDADDPPNMLSKNVMNWVFYNLDVTGTPPTPPPSSSKARRIRGGKGGGGVGIWRF